MLGQLIRQQNKFARQKYLPNQAVSSQKFKQLKLGLKFWIVQANNSEDFSRLSLLFQ
jgi:hypothetical protein